MVNNLDLKLDLDPLVYAKFRLFLKHNFFDTTISFINLLKSKIKNYNIIEYNQEQDLFIIKLLNNSNNLLDLYLIINDVLYEHLQEIYYKNSNNISNEVLMIFKYFLNFKISLLPLVNISLISNKEYDIIYIKL